MRDEGTFAGYPSLASPRALAIASDHGDDMAARRRRVAALASRGRLALRVLAALGLGPEDLAAALKAAGRNGTDAGAELVASGRVREEDLALAIADALQLPAERILAGDGPLPAIGGAPAPERVARVLATCDAAGRTKLFLAPALEQMEEVAELLRQHPGRRAEARVTTGREIGRRLAETSVAARSERARLSLSADRPERSARQVVTGAQGFAAGVLLSALAAFVAHSPLVALAALHVLAMPLYLACVALRMAAAVTLLRRPRASSAVTKPGTDRGETGPRPVYSVLVALHREAEIVPALVAGLAALQWPRSRLQVLLVCERDDPETVAAVARSIAAEPGFELVLVPPSLPRTKPKALNFALPLARGDFVVLYDAEDRPAPGQIEEAWRAFAAGGERLACLQAPLIIGNGSGNWYAGHFALEYAALFRGFLPWLARHGLPLPLGGTSNHFRRDVLAAVGAWDSHNVTEDADLGMRLARAGYRIGMIGAPTFEDAPERWLVWRNQRTRWMKGWLQTWLCHMRDPLALWRDLGARSFLAFQVLFFGMIASSAAHAFFLVSLAATLWALASGAMPGLGARGLLAVDLINLVCGYASFACLAVATLDAEERAVLPRRLWSLPVYWLLVSVAALRAFGQIFVAPHAWEKTPHGAKARAAVPAPRREPLFDFE